MKKAKKSGAKKSNGAPKPAKRREGVERARYTRKLAVPIDEVTAAKKGRELAKAVHERDAFKEARRADNAEARAKVAYFDERIEELATSVDECTEIRDVECVEVLVVETNEVQVTRLDTGEVVETRAAEAVDRQEVLDLDAQPDEAKKGTAAKRAKRGGKTTVVPADASASAE